MSTLAASAVSQSTQLSSREDGAFRFPKWYADYLRGYGRSGTLVIEGDALRLQRLAFLHEDGHTRHGKLKQSQPRLQRFPTLRNGHASRLDNAAPNLSVERTQEGDWQRKSKKQKRLEEEPNHLGASIITERYNSFATVADVGSRTQRLHKQQQQHQQPASSVLYSNLRCSSRARLCDFNKAAPVTIPSVGDIRRNCVTLPPISIKKIG